MNDDEQQYLLDLDNSRRRWRNLSITLSLFSAMHLIYIITQ